jgi:beta-glucosidase
VQVLRSATGGRIGIVNHHTTVDAASRSRSDIAAAACYHAYHNRQFTDPVLRGSYRDEILRMPGVADDVISDGDLEVISAPLDFYGVTFHHPTMVAAAHGNSSVPFTPEETPGVPLTDSGWPVRPASLTRLLVDLTADYPSLPPLYVAANGCAYRDVDDPGDATVSDAKPAADVERIAYLDGHLAAVADAVAGGCEVLGYFYSTAARHRSTTTPARLGRPAQADRRSTSSLSGLTLVSQMRPR